MIPKIIHCGVFSGWKRTPLEERCLASWKSVLPDYEIREWSENNGPRHDRFFRESSLLRPVNASNFIRYWALYMHGGIYLDNDVEVLRPFDLSPQCFLGFQRDDTEQDCINTAVIGSEAGHAFPFKCLARCRSDSPDTWPVWLGCGLPTEELRIAGMTGLNVEQTVSFGATKEPVTVYSKERFYPWRWDEDSRIITERTFAIHHWGGTWK